MALTQQQIEEARKAVGITTDVNYGASRVAELRKKAAQYNSQNQTRFQETIGDVKQTVSNLGKTYQKTKEKIGKIGEANVKGEQEYGRSLLQTAGAVAGGISQGIGDIFTGAVKTVLPQQTEEKVKQMAITAISEADKALGSPLARLMENYNNLDDKTKKDVDALMGISQLALDLTGFGVGKKVGEIGIKTGIETGKKTLVGTSKIAGEIISPITKSREYLSSRFPKLLGIFTGENDDIIRTALKNPEVANLGIEQGDEALRKAVSEGAENSIKIKNAFIKGFSEAKNNIMGEYTKTLIPKNNIIGEFNKLLKENGVIIGKDGKLNFTISLIKANPGEITKIKDAYAALKKWDKFTIDSLDEYKQLIGKLTRFATEAGVPSKSPFLGKLYNNLNEIAYSKLPKDIAEKYKLLNQKFSNGIEMYDEIVDAFNSGDPFTKLANSLGKNKDTLRQIIEFYEQKTGKDVLPIVAGRELAMEKTAAFGFLNPRSWIDFFISPKVQAKIITKIGELGQKLPK